ncbi:unnamed protein product, partial [Symbiodinium pilosum]
VLCRAQDAPTAEPADEPGAAVEQSDDDVDHGVINDIPRDAYILSTQDIDAHEASFDCGARVPSIMQDTGVSSMARSGKAASFQESSSTVPARLESVASEQGHANGFQAGMDQPSAGCDDTQIYVLPPSCGTGAEGLQTLAYTSHAVALEVLSSPALNAETLPYEAQEPSSPLHAAVVGAETLEYAVPTPPRETVGKKAAFVETLPYGLPEELHPSFIEVPGVPQPVATPVRKRSQGGAASPCLLQEARLQEGAVPTGETGRSAPPSKARRRAGQSAEEDSKWLVPVKRRRVGQPSREASHVSPKAPKLAEGRAQAGVAPVLRRAQEAQKEPKDKRTSRPAGSSPCRSSKMARRRMPSTVITSQWPETRQSSLSEFWSRASSVPRSQVTVETIDCS